MTNYKSGDSVTWKWANGTGHGMVQNVHTERTEIQSKGETIVRNGTNDNPAIHIHDENGANVLKLASELEKAS